jgi:hypothetical protein
LFEAEGRISVRHPGFSCRKICDISAELNANQGFNSAAPGASP